MTTATIEPLQRNGFGLSVHDIAEMDTCELIQKLSGPSKPCAHCGCGLHESTTGRRLLREPDGETVEVCSDCYFGDTTLLSMNRRLEPECDGILTKEQSKEFFAMYLNSK